MMTLKNTIRTLTLITLAAALTGCSKEEAFAPEGEAKSIVFTTPDNWGDVTRLSGTDFEAYDRIGVFAFYHPEGATDGSEFMVNQMVEKTDAGWTYNPVKYWPTMADDKLSFYAYYPYSPDRRGDEVSLTIDGATDILWADKINTTDVPGTPLSQSDGVNFKFSHKLNHIRFKFVQGDRYPDGKTVTSVRITNVLTQATLNYKTGEFETSTKGTIGTVGLTPDTPWLITKSGTTTEGLYIGEIAGERLSVEITMDGKTSTLSLPDYEYVAGGKSFLYSIKYDQPFVIETIEDFVEFRTAVENGNTFEGRTVSLAANLDFSGETFTPVGSTDYFNGGPTYSNSKPFKGTFEGNGYTLKNITIEKPESGGPPYTYGQGLFGYTYGATIQNLKMTNISITCSKYVGSLVGLAENTKCQNITLTDIKIKGESGIAGGMIGEGKNMNISNIKIQSSNNTLSNSVKGPGEIGGVFGIARDIIGIEGVEVDNVKISSTGSEVSRAGGFAGLAERIQLDKKLGNPPPLIKVSNCGIDSEIWAGGIVGYIESGNYYHTEIIDCAIQSGGGSYGPDENPHAGYLAGYGRNVTYGSNTVDDKTTLLEEYGSGMGYVTAEKKYISDDDDSCKPDEDYPNNPDLTNNNK